MCGNVWGVGVEREVWEGKWIEVGGKMDWVEMDVGLVSREGGRTNEPTGWWVWGGDGWWGVDVVKCGGEVADWCDVWGEGKWVSKAVRSVFCFCNDVWRLCSTSFDCYSVSRLRFLPDSLGSWLSKFNEIWEDCGWGVLFSSKSFWVLVIEGSTFFLEVLFSRRWFCRITSGSSEFKVLCMLRFNL